MKIINLTDHPVKILDNKNRIIRQFPRSKNPVRLTVDLSHDGFVDGIQITACKIGKVKNLPQREDGVFYIVSNFVKNMLYAVKTGKLAHL